ncbi:hypothetical protein MTR67_037114 [Solanum verrucosum]|uniref:Uncharacterized protein n=1 Tax=Solanum verrucosum TaxID=315347 RepID=A0AAF0ZNY0_SOLVR|nr:hypothetical protein MTR67_037114 [Solanum verrucosum]
MKGSLLMGFLLRYLMIISTTLIQMYSRCGRAEIAHGLNLYADLVSSRLEDTEINHFCWCLMCLCP